LREPGLDDLTLRVFRADDVEAVAHLHKQCFPNGWSADDFRRLSQAAAYTGLTAWVGETLVGFLVVSIAADEAEIVTLGVVKRKRRRGIAAALLTRLFRDLCGRQVAALLLEVKEDNEAACKLYEASGFAAVANRPGYYAATDGRKNAVVMRRVLKGAIGVEPD